jgi:hypothetical protein
LSTKPRGTQDSQQGSLSRRLRSEHAEEVRGREPGERSRQDRDADTMTTREDTDPAMSLGTLSMRDDETGPLGAFTLIANVESVAPAHAR